MTQNKMLLQLLLVPVVVLSTSKSEPVLLNAAGGKAHPSVSGNGDFFLSHEPPVDPEFAEAETNVTAQLDGTVFLHCPIVATTSDRAVSYPIISWIRMRDWHILTHGAHTFTADERFSVLHKEGSYDWVLQIKYVQQRDAGDYECQVSTSTGTVSRRVTLDVVSPVAFILGGDEYHINRGSQISLVCVIEKAPEPPQYVFWYHNDRMVNYDQERGVSVATSTGLDSTKSRFNIREATPSDSGNYTCKPSNAMPASIQVFVSKGRVDKMEALHKQSSLLINTPSAASDGLERLRGCSQLLLASMVTALALLQPREA